MPKTYVKVAGVWKTVNKAHVKVGGVWKAIKKAYVKAGGVWKLIHALHTVSLQSSASSEAATIIGPADIQAGDLLVLWDVAVRSSGVPPAAVPTGFTTIVDQNGSIRIRITLSCKIADGSEASATLTGMTANEQINKLLYVFRGNVPISVATPVDPSFVFNSGGNPAPFVINAAGAAVPLVVVAGYFEYGGAVNVRGFSPAKDGEIQLANGDTWLAYKIYNASPADVTLSGNVINSIAGCYFLCS